MTIIIEEIPISKMILPYTKVTCSIEYNGVEYATDIYVKGHGKSEALDAAIDEVFEWYELITIMMQWG